MVKKVDKKLPSSLLLFLLLLSPSSYSRTDADANRHATPNGTSASPTTKRIAAACALVGRPSQCGSSCCEKRESFFFFGCRKEGRKKRGAEEKDVSVFFFFFLRWRLLLYAKKDRKKS